MVQSLSCLDCGYVWKPRKDATRYKCQCPHCKHTHLDENKSARNKQVGASATVARVRQPTTTGSRWPQIVYDLQGVSGASSPDNGLARAYELIRRLLPYKFKYNLESIEETFDLLEKRAAEENRKAIEARTSATHFGRSETDFL